MTTNRAAVDLFSTRIPVDGWASLPLLASGAAIGLALPAAAAVLLCGLAGGAVAAFVMIRHRG